MKLTTAQLLELLDDIKSRVQTGDSFEGNLSYNCLDFELQEDEWEVVGQYRIGNIEGQGGMRVFFPSLEQVCLSPKLQ